MSYTPQEIGTDQVPTDASFTGNSWKDFNVITLTDPSGDIGIKYDIVHIATTVAGAITLSDGAVGQRMILKLTTAGGDCVLTPDNLFDGSTITFSLGGDSVEIYFDGTNWNVVGTATATVA